ncbi:hypothetical protein TSAR_003019 [Trichomalopsis sarcophagae]|uniref:Ubiquitin-like domain-containing protein n=1 Tax=Trichomalopsis sarcophagae TaxID=543379 RepID=A0A232FHC3_9HYME|nr:hypothetical protein TSAR_003019 [Trichomalopsis sarcophagae]
MDKRVVKLTIRDSSQVLDDQKVDCDENWQIAQLKEHLSDLYPSKPKPCDQKLIYCGYVLDNHALLKNIFHEDDNNINTFIVHLLCKTNLRNVKKQSIEATQPKVEKPAVVSTAESNSTWETTTFRHFGDYSSSELSEQQRLWLQEAYKYYASCYMHLCSTQGFVVPDRFGNLQTMFPVNTNPTFAADHMKNYLNHPPRNQDSSSSNNDNINDNNSNNNNLNNNNVNINNNNNNNNNLNINNNHVEEDLAMGNNRDWLDNFYTLSRVIVLFSIVYFYSSPIRFIIVVFLGFVIYLYQNGFFRNNPALFTENNNEPVENNNRRNNNENQTPEERRPLQDAPASENEVPAQTRQNENDDRPGALSFTWIFFSSFFTSLVPDHPNIA